MVKEIVFDFDGTIALTLEASVRAVNKLSEKYGFRKVTNEDVEIFREKGWKQAIKGFKVSILKIPQILLDGQKEMAKEIEAVEMVEGLDRVLIELKKKGYVLGVLTSNSLENAERFFDKYNLKFDYVYSEKTLFGKEKAINKLLEDRGLNKEEIVYVGDETRDWEACEKAGVKMIGVGWGFNTAEALKKNGLENVAISPMELIEKV